MLSLYSCMERLKSCIMEEAIAFASTAAAAVGPPPTRDHINNRMLPGELHMHIHV